MSALDAAGLRPVEVAGLTRLGAAHDGGYVVPIEAIRRAKQLVAFGVSIDWSFERECVARNPGLAVTAYDHTVGPSFFLRFGMTSAVALVLRLLGGRLDKARLSIGNLRASLDYFLFFRGRVRHVRKRVWHNTDRGSESIDDIIVAASSAGPASVFAKIDIEGGEYRILPAVIRHARLFTGIAIEFHDTDLCAAPLERMLSDLREQFYVVHVHGNNFCEQPAGALPTAVEVTLINKALLDGIPPPYRGVLPRPGLDAPNDPLSADFVLQA
jgi:hypothetical protein